MKITYIHHSGFLVELRRVCLLFDFVGGPLPRLDDGRDLVVFASHRHGDHFDPMIFDLAKSYPCIRFVLSDDIWQNRIPEGLGCRTEFTDPGDVLELYEGDGVRITSFQSTDEGVAFLVETEGQVIYHAGDLNDWRWNGEPLAWNNNMSTNYKRELDKIKALGLTPDVAMLPLDGRQEDLFWLGLDEFMRTVGAKFVLPMHFWEDYEVINRLKAMDCAVDYRDRIADIRAEGQVFELGAAGNPARRGEPS
ncbi:MAG: MBL fold metallo-hydrolase [Lachnospiraceae bacterium]|nr:MBL fold metallo-hydrolase [Lachnospiraceae bacterium]